MRAKLSVGFLAVVLAFSGSVPGLACTTFVLKNSQTQVFGRNYDWMLGDALVVVNKRGCSKRSITQPEETGEKAAWRARYGSVTFNQYGREMPQGGMNEAGLVVESMALDETRYPPSDDRPYLGAASQWRQYLLDTCATVAEVIAADRKVRISHKAGGPGIHVLVMDKNGDCAAIEFLDGRMKVHAGGDLPVAALTNDTYETSLQCLHTNRPPVYDPWQSVHRFMTAAEWIRSGTAKTGDALVSHAFDALAAVSSGRTQWRIVYDNRNMTVHFKTLANGRVREIRVSALDFSPQTPVLILDANANLGGNVTDDFSAYTYEANRRLIGNAFRKTSFLRGIPEERLDALARFPDQLECR